PLGTDWNGEMDEMPKAKDGKVLIVGNDLSQDRVIRRAIDILPGTELLFGDFYGWRATKADVKEALFGHSDANLEVFGRRAREADVANNDRAFFDLVAYAPGMNTSWADIEAILDAEALPDDFSRKGKIDAGARKLFAKARKHGWQTLTIPAAGLQPAYTITFDGSGRFAYER